MTLALSDASAWSATPLGSPTDWPVELRAVAAVMWRTRSPQWMALGPDLRLVYNQAMLEILGDKHPASMGRPLREVWAEIWDDVGPLIARTLAGESLFFEHLPLRIVRHGAPIDTWFTFSYTPLETADGDIIGVHCTVLETTAAMLHARERDAASVRMTELWAQAPGFVAVTRGPQHVYELANRAYLQFVGERPLIGLPVREAIPELDPKFIALLDHVYASGEPYIGRRIPVGLRRETDGVVEDRIVDFVFQPIRDADGGPRGIFIQGADNTDLDEAEKAADAEQRRLRALLEALPIGVAYADPSGQLRTVNAALADVWGDYPTHNAVDDYAGWVGWWPAGHARAGERLRADDWPMARALAGDVVRGEVVEIEPFGLPGTRRTILLNSSPVHDSGRAIAGAVTTQQDISDRMRAEAELRESESRFRTMANAMPQMVWSTLPDGYHDFYNDQWYEFTGVAYGSTDGEGWNGMFHPDDQPIAWERWRRSLSTGEPYEIEYRLRHRSGEYRWVLGRALPVYDEAGQITRWMGTCTDIHLRKLAQAALGESEERFRALADNIPQLAWMTDSDGWIFWYNGRWFDFTGTTLEQMQGWGWRAVHHPEHVERVTEKFKHHIDNGEPWEDTFPLRGADGEYRWFLSRARPLRDADGRITRWLGTNTDITTQREAEHALREADRRKDEFLAMLAHELRNPLAPIATAAELLRVPNLEPARAQSASAVIGRQVRHMTELVDDLLDVSRVTRGLITLDDEVFDLRSAVSAAIEQARPLLEARRHRLDVRTGDVPLWIRGDRTRITQVAANLLNNAAKYTPVSGRIELTTRVDGDAAVLDVTDNGQGIDATLMPHIFDLFAQGERMPDRAQGGLGIGLALVRSLAQLHGGDVEAASDGPGEGSRFSVRLPRVEAPDASMHHERHAPIDAGHLDIVIVDDNVDAAQTLAELLDVWGHRVRVLHDGVSALALPDDVPVDLYLLDIGLPDLSGHDIARRLRADPVRRHAALFALTGYGQERDQSESQQAGFDRHFVKPVDARALQVALEEIARARRTS